MANIFWQFPNRTLQTIIYLSIQSEFLVTSCTSTNDLPPSREALPSPSGFLQFPSHSTLDYHYIIERVDCTYALISYPDLTLSYAYFPWPQEIWVRDYLCPTDWTTNHFESSEVEATSRKTRPGLLTPLDKFRGGLGYVSVSDLTAQFWCEQQMEYNFLAPEPKPETVQMQLGKDIHMARGKLVNKFNFLKLFITWIWVHIIHF